MQHIVLSHIFIELFVYENSIESYCDNQPCGGDGCYSVLECLWQITALLHTVKTSDNRHREMALKTFVLSS